MKNAKKSDEMVFERTKDNEMKAIFPITDFIFHFQKNCTSDSDCGKLACVEGKCNITREIRKVRPRFIEKQSYKSRTKSLGYRVRNYVLSWRIVYAIIWVLFWCVFRSLLRNSWNQHQDCTFLSASIIGHSRPYINIYRQTSNTRRSLLGTKVANHSHVVGASPVGAAPSTFSFST